MTTKSSNNNNPNASRAPNYNMSLASLDRALPNRPLEETDPSRVGLQNDTPEIDEDEDPLRATGPIVHTRSNSVLRVNMTDAELRVVLDQFGVEYEFSSRKKRDITQAQQQVAAAPTGITDNKLSTPRILGGYVACLCSATLGAGILALPYSMAEAGLLFGMMMLLASAIATAYSIQLIVQAMQVIYFSNHGNAYTSNIPQHHNQQQEKTYEHLVEACLGKGARRIAEASMLIFCLGAAVAYVIAVGDILEKSGWDIVSQNQQLSRIILMAITWLCAMLPLSMLRTMKSLQCASSIGIASIATLVVAALFHCIGDHYQSTTVPTQAPLPFQEGEDDERHSIFIPTQGLLSVLRACPIILFAFSCQVNVCAIYDEIPANDNVRRSQHVSNNSNVSGEGVEIPPLSGPDASDNGSDGMMNPLTIQLQQEQSATKYGRMNWVTWLAVGICALLYSSISIVALLDFGSIKMTPNILSSYTPQGMMQVAFVGMAVAVVLAYPMNIFPARVTVLGILRSRRKDSIGIESANNSNDLAEPLLTPAESTEPTSTAVPNYNHRDNAKETWVEHVMSTLGLSGLSLGLAIVAPNISVVFGLMGGTCSSVLGFVIPGLLGYVTANEFYDGCNAGAAKRTRVLSFLLVIAGVVVGVITTAVTLYSTFAMSKK